MKKVIKKSFNIFIARASGPFGIFILFSISGYLVDNKIGELNLFISFISVFSTIASVALVYFQNEVSRDIDNKNIFYKGIQMSLTLGIALAVISIILSKLTLSEVSFHNAIIIASITYPLTGVIAFLTYYYEGIGRPEAASKPLSYSIAIQGIIFFILLEVGMEILSAVAFTFVIIDIVVIILLLLQDTKVFFYCKWEVINLSDIASLLSKGLPMSFGVAIQKYLFSLVVLAVSTLNVFSVNTYTTITNLIFLVSLPIMGISHSASIYISQERIVGENFKNCIVIALTYIVFIAILLFNGLPFFVKVIYNFYLPEHQINQSIFSAILFFISQSVLLFILALARAYEIIKTPQLLACSAMFIGLCASKILATTPYDYINIISLCLIGASYVILRIIQKQTNFCMS